MRDSFLRAPFRMVALDEDEHIPSSSDSIRVYSMRVTSPERSPRKRSPERSPRKRPASSGADVPAVDLSAAATESVGAERPVPQLLRDGFAKVREEGWVVTDDVSIVEQMGAPVKLTLGEYTNLKLTTPEDMVIADQILAGRE